MVTTFCGQEHLPLKWGIFSQNPLKCVGSKTLENERDAKLAEVTEGYRRLAFGSVADAVKLILSDELPDGSEIEKLDLTMVSDIKCPKNGGIEVKFFDRLKALDRLCELSNAASAGENSDFLCALDRSARALRGDDAGE